METPLERIEKAAFEYAKNSAPHNQRSFVEQDYTKGAVSANNKAIDDVQDEIGKLDMYGEDNMIKLKDIEPIFKKLKITL